MLLVYIFSFIFLYNLKFDIFAVDSDDEMERESGLGTGEGELLISMSAIGKINIIHASIFETIFCVMACIFFMIFALTNMCVCLFHQGMDEESGLETGPETSSIGVFLEFMNN